MSNNPAEASGPKGRSNSLSMEKLGTLLEVLRYEEPTGEDLPNYRPDPGTLATPAGLFWAEVARTLTADPGRWALIRIFDATEQKARGNAVSLRRRIVKHQLKTLRLAAKMNDHYESEIKVDDDGNFRVYARYVTV